jgi:hypothetical protein
MLTLLEKHMPSRGLKKPMSRDLKRISAGVSLVMLALGFSLLGILSFMNRLQGELATGSALEKNCCVAGGAGSLLTGAIFLVAAGIYWSRWPAEPPAAGDD